MSVFNAQQINEMFGAALDGGTEATEKMAEATGLYIQDKLRENSFARKILSPQTVTLSELTREVDGEGLSYIDDIEPDSVAMAINWRGEPNRTYIEGKRYAINLSTITSERIQKSEQELRSYKMPLLKVIEQNIIKDIQETIDARFMAHVKAGLFLATVHRHNQLLARSEITSTRNFNNEAKLYAYLYKHATTTNGIITSNSGAMFDLSNLNADTTTWGTFTQPVRQSYFANLILGDQTTFSRYAVSELAKVLASRQLKLGTILMHEVDFADILAWTEAEAGLRITEEIVVGGFKYTTIGGIKYVTTVRDNPDIVAPGQIFGFPAPEFLGRYLVLENTKFFMKKEGRFISMEAWEDLGIGFGNIKGIACYLMRGASLTMPARWIDAAGAAEPAGSGGNTNGYWSGTGGLGGNRFFIRNVTPSNGAWVAGDFSGVNAISPFTSYSQA